MDRLDAMSVFVKVVETGSFSQAADALGSGRPTVTRTIQSLENYLNAQLFQRSTRRMSVTAEGERYYQHCTRLICEISELEESFSLRTEDTHGRLRIALPAYVAKHFIVPRLREFTDEYPNIELSLCIAEPKADISLTGADCVIKAGPLPDSSLVARPLATLPMVTAASESFLRTHGVPKTIKDLAAYSGIRQGTGTERHCEMSFVEDSEPVQVRLPMHLAVDDVEMAIACAAGGLGLIQSYRFLVQPYIASGQLLEVFAELPPPPQPLFAIYPKLNHRSRALQTFVDWIHQSFDQTPILRVNTRCSGEIYLPVETSRLATSLAPFRVAS